jgi:hypothetical protein
MCVSMRVSTSVSTCVSMCVLVYVCYSGKSMRRCECTCRSRNEYVLEMRRKEEMHEDEGGDA